MALADLRRGLRRQLCTLFVVAAGGAGLSAPGTARADGAADCQALARADFSGIVDAPSQILSTRFVAKSDALPAHCIAEAYVSPNIGLEIYLPTETWNGKFLKRGCGGMCGQFQFNPWMPLCKTTLPRGYACILEDMGHRSTPLDGKWAYNNLQAEVDYAFRSTHLTTVAGKAIVEAFYGRPITRSYFLGGSTGGRQGLLLAQRFPNDFDGIMAGAPGGTDVHGVLAVLWAVLANLDEADRPILTPDHVRTLHAAAMAACDGQDGLADGIITDPLACAFDPVEAACAAKPGAARPGAARPGAARPGAACLDARQVDAARKIYDGPVNSAGRRWARGAARGSELNWIGNYVARGPGEQAGYASFHGDRYRYLTFAVDPGPAWSIRDFDWDRDPDRMYAMASLSSAANPDLRAFKARGGKLIMWHGWSDQSVLPWGSIDYYEMVERAMGGRTATQAFFRFFLMPGVNHVYRGAGADLVDFVAAIEQWVEHGIAPDALIGVHLKTEPRESDFNPAGPIDPATVAFTRPHFPYPVQARYDGRGDPARAASFVPYERPR